MARKKAEREREIAKKEAAEELKRQHEKLLKEERRRRDLRSSCQNSKVRTYACGKDGYRVIKYFNWDYDFEQEKCLKKVKRTTDKC